MLKGQILGIIVYTACLTRLSEQAILTCDGGDTPRFSMEDVRVVGRLDNLIFLGSAQYVTVFDGQTFTTEYFGVCYGTGASNCYKTNSDVENCDNYIRAVVDLGSSSMLVCGTNAKLSQCDTCALTGSELSCDFTENEPPQDLPYNAATDSGYSPCTSLNEGGTEVFQYIKNHNATFLYYDGYYYYGLVKSDSNEKSIIGRADGDRENKVITRTDSDKMVATEAHFVGKPFVNGDYVYFLFREPAQEFASLSACQDPSIDTYYSRIARICKDDVGAPVSGTQTLTSFLKQRLVCSITSEDSTFYYNDIQDFACSDIDCTMIHAIFTNERNAAPQSALCYFTLTSIDETFNVGDFFGADGVSKTNDLWRVYDGIVKSPRPGLNCENPNTADTDFERDYNLMSDPAVGTVQFFLVGDRFSNLEMTSEDGTEVYIISSERGCLYRAEVEGTAERYLGDPCQDPVVSRPIKDLELTENGYLVTTDDHVYVLSSCSDPTTPSPSVSPPTLVAETVICVDATSPCENGGTCADGACTCVGTFTGDLCSDFTCVDATSPCENGGTCADGACTCVGTFTGDLCSDFSTASSSPSVSSPPNSNSTVIGSAVGVIVVTVIVIVLVIIFYKRRSNESASTKSRGKESDSSPQYENPVFDQSQTDVHTYQDLHSDAQGYEILTGPHPYEDINTVAQGYDDIADPHTNQDLNTDAQGYDDIADPHTYLDLNSDA